MKIFFKKPSAIIVAGKQMAQRDLSANQSAPTEKAVPAAPERVNRNGLYYFYQPHYSKRSPFTERPRRDKWRDST